MSEINGIANVDSKNTYNVNANKRTQESHSDFSAYLGTTKSMDDIFEQAAKEYNVPVQLLKAIGKAESNFNAKAVSKAGAQGVMQLMPQTAKELGVTDSFDAEQNIMGGAKYISGLLKKYDGDTKLALAAYNAGSGNVRKYGGIPPFTETQNYVKKVMNYLGEDSITITAANNNITKGSSNSGVISTKNYGNTATNLGFLLAQDVESSSDELNDLEILFSYEDYLKFLDLFLTEEDKSKEDNSKYIVKDITFSAPVLNLLKEQKQS